jgi:putative transposase
VKSHHAERDGYDNSHHAELDGYDRAARQRRAMDSDFHLFDANSETHIVERRLPHWSQAGTVCFITWRTHDSMPRAVLEAWFQDRNRWLQINGIDPVDRQWRQKLQKLDRHVARQFLNSFWNRWHDALDQSQGACVLRCPGLAAIVAQGLRHFDGERYLMFDFVVMPNHVHLLASFPDEGAMLAQCESWKHYTAMQINRRLNRKGRFWQQDGFDHLVRSEEQLEYLRRYIQGNPAKAMLRPGEFVDFSRPLAMGSHVSHENSSRGA